MEVPIIRPAVAWYASERIVEGRSPDHNWISVQLTEARMRAVSPEQVVGHCILPQPGPGAERARER